MYKAVNGTLFWTEWGDQMALPVLETDFVKLEKVTIPSKTYRMDFENTRMSGMCDGLETMKQVVYKILNTQRYQWLIYSWNYGVETDDLFGMPMSYVIPEIQRRYPEALLMDDRITAVDSFEFKTPRRHDLVVSFTVHTIYGDFNTERVINV